MRDLRSLALFSIFLTSCILFIPSLVFAQATNENSAPNTNRNNTVSQGIETCKFYRPDQKTGSAYCPPADQGYRCEEGLTYKSPYLLGIFQEAAQKSGVPAEVLAGVARFESTVPKQVSATGLSYSLLDYTDEDVKKMEEFGKRVTAETIDETIPNTSKALCPRSYTGALGIVQVQPPAKILDQLAARGILKLPGEDQATNNKNAGIARSANSKEGMEFAAQMMGITPDQITLEHFCNPRTALLLGAGVMKAKMGGKWAPPPDQASYETYIKTLGEGYYGKDANTKQYIGGLWQSVLQCKGGTPSQTTSTSSSNSSGSVSGSSSSNTFCTKVGNAKEEDKPAVCSAQTSATGGGIITTGSGVFYCQSDPLWGTFVGKGGCSLASAGCGPTTLAMVLGRFGNGEIPNSETWGSAKVPELVRGTPTNPPNIYTFFTSQLNWHDCGVGSYMGNVWPWLRSIGYQDVPITASFEAVAEQINAKHLVIGSVNAYPLSGGGTVGHLFGISGANPQDRTLTLFDPAKCGGETVRTYNEVTGWGLNYFVGIFKK